MVVRLCTAALALLNLAWGAWARLSPRSFFDSFPGFGQRWLAAYPPYNVHLVTDLGATLLTLGLLLLVGAMSAERRVRARALAGFLIFSTIHLTFHATNPGTLSTTDVVVSTSSLVAGALVSILLLIADRWADARRVAPATLSEAAGKPE